MIIKIIEMPPRRSGLEFVNDFHFPRQPQPWVEAKRGVLSVQHVHLEATIQLASKVGVLCCAIASDCQDLIDTPSFHLGCNSSAEYSSFLVDKGCTYSSNHKSAVWCSILKRGSLGLFMEGGWKSRWSRQVSQSVIFTWLSNDQCAIFSVVLWMDGCFVHSLSLGTWYIRMT